MRRAMATSVLATGRTVSCGQRSFDEMMVCMFNVAFDAKITTKQMLSPGKPNQSADLQ